MAGPLMLQNSQIATADYCIDFLASPSRDTQTADRPSALIPRAESLKIRRSDRAGSDSLHQFKYTPLDSNQ